MWEKRRTLLVVLGSAIACGAVAPSTSEAAKNAACTGVLGNASIHGPTKSLAWRAGIEARTAVFYRAPSKDLQPSRWLLPTAAPWLMVVGHPRTGDGRCWVHVQLPWRPNGSAGWVNADKVQLEPTSWRISVSTAHRTLTVFRSGKVIRTVRVVVGKSSTPTPVGLFAVVWAIRWHPSSFLGSWVLELTAHSDVLRHFDGGDGTVGIHGRGGASLLDPLGSARSHGCIRLSNRAIDRLARTIGASDLPGTPVQVG